MTKPIDYDILPYKLVTTLQDTLEKELTIALIRAHINNPKTEAFINLYYNTLEGKFLNYSRALLKGELEDYKYIHEPFMNIYLEVHYTINCTESYFGLKRSIHSITTALKETEKNHYRINK